MFKYRLSFCLLIFCFSSIFSQTIAITEDGRKVVLKDDKTWDFLTEKSDENKPIVSENKVVGDDIKELFKFISGISEKLKKSEFETQDQYLKRLELIITETKFNGKSLEDTVLIFTPDLSYNAESQEFSTSPFILSIKSDIDLVEWKYGSFSMSFDLLTLSFKLNPDKAQKEKSSISLAMYGIPVGVKNGNLQFIPTKYVFYNKVSNEIYSEIEQNEDKDVSDSRSNSSPSINSNGHVRVRGYFRKDGKYIRPHNRKRPKN